jgi:microsomal dipeptidase-like Zn-dependent dipeptidase
MMLADLHCHYPMHLLPQDTHPHEHSASWFRRLRDKFEAWLLDEVADELSNPDDGDWRISLDGLAEGGARIVCSVLYSPADEFDLDSLDYDAPPEPGYFADLKHQVELVKHDLRKQDPEEKRHRIARRGKGLPDDERVTFVHCVEGGFHFGPDPDAIDGQVKWLADQGVVYITVAHLFFRGVAASAPAIPKLSDEQYEKVFHQDAGVGLTEIGEALVRAMYEHDVLVDVSHMRQDAIDETFDLIEQLDAKKGKNPPVIATHVGARDVVPEQSYNASRPTIERIADRGGLVGMIMAQHQMGQTATEDETRAVLKKHADAIAAAAGGHQCTAIGTDLDGFIKPTLAGIERAPDLAKLAEWIHELYPDDGDAILHGNARRVLSSVLA